MKLQLHRQKHFEAVKLVFMRLSDRIFLKLPTEKRRSFETCAGETLAFVVNFTLVSSVTSYVNVHSTSCLPKIILELSSKPTSYIYIIRH